MFSAIASALAPAVGPILGGITSGIFGKQRDDDQKREAQKQRTFQKGMSDTAHQREVEDLIAAGLNPILSAGGPGASTPSGSQAQMNGLSEAINKGFNSALAFKTAVANVGQIKRQTNQIRQTTKGIKTENAIKEIELNHAKQLYDVVNSSSALKGLYYGGQAAKQAGLGKVGSAAAAGGSMGTYFADPAINGAQALFRSLYGNTKRGINTFRSWFKPKTSTPRKNIKPSKKETWKMRSTHQ